MTNFNLELKGAFKKFTYFDTIDSTSLYAKSLINCNECDGTIIVAKTQTLGRGRTGRVWTSPEGGIWFSFIVCPTIIYYDCFSLITLLVGVSVAKAINKVCNINCNLKWPNDILLGSKKVCGILVENVSDGNKNTVIVGIGINSNVDASILPDEIIKKATSLKSYLGKEIDNQELIQGILDNFNDYYSHFCNADYKYIIDEWCRNSDIIGKEIMYIGNGQSRTGKVMEISDKGELVVRRKDGEIEKIKSGEISIRNVSGIYY